MARCAKQSVTALSTVEAEFYAICAGVTSEAYIRQLLELLCVEVGCTPIYCDTQGAIQFSENPVSNSRVKHVRTRYSYVRDALQEKVVELNYVPGSENCSDILTKALGKVKHLKFCKQLFSHDLSVRNYQCHCKLEEVASRLTLIRRMR